MIPSWDLFSSVDYIESALGNQAFGRFSGLKPVPEVSWVE